MSQDATPKKKVFHHSVLISSVTRPNEFQNELRMSTEVPLYLVLSRAVNVTDAVFYD